MNTTQREIAKHLKESDVLCNRATVDRNSQKEEGTDKRFCIHLMNELMMVLKNSKKGSINMLML